MRSYIFGIAYIKWLYFYWYRPPFDFPHPYLHKMSISFLNLPVVIAQLDLLGFQQSTPDTFTY